MKKGFAIVPASIHAPESREYSTLEIGPLLIFALHPTCIAEFCAVTVSITFVGAVGETEATRQFDSAPAPFAFLALKAKPVPAAWALKTPVGSVWFELARTEQVALPET
jgi:hypothetical protein